MSAKVFGLYSVDQRGVGGIEGFKQRSRMAIFALEDFPLAAVSERKRIALGPGTQMLERKRGKC